MRIEYLQTIFTRTYLVFSYFNHIRIADTIIKFAEKFNKHNSFLGIAESA